jgi:integrase
MDYVRRIGWIEKNPVSDVVAPPVAPARIRWLSVQQRIRLLDACGNSGNRDLRLVVEIALDSGARQAEILGLRWPWIDFDSECAFLPPEITKTDEPRVMPLPGAIMNELRKRAKVRRIDSDLVFFSPEKPNQPRNIRNAWQVARKLAGLPDFRFHDLRHSAATAMLRAGVDSRIVATVLGHSVAEHDAKIRTRLPGDGRRSGEKSAALNGTPAQGAF